SLARSGLSIARNGAAPTPSRENAIRSMLIDRTARTPHPRGRAAACEARGTRPPRAVNGRLADVMCRAHVSWVRTGFAVDRALEHAPSHSEGVRVVVPRPPLGTEKIATRDHPTPALLLPSSAPLHSF